MRLYRADAIIIFIKKTGRGKGSEELFLLHLHNVGFGSALSIPVKRCFPVLLLLSPLTTFAKYRIRLGSAKDVKTSFSLFVVALASHYICKIKNTVAVTRGAVRQRHSVAVASVKIKPE